MPIREAPYVPRPYAGDGLIRLADLGLQASRSQANAVRDRGDRSAQMWGMAGNAIAQGIGTIRQEREMIPLREAAARKMAIENEQLRRHDEAYREGRAAKDADAAEEARFKELSLQHEGPIPIDVLVREFGRETTGKILGLYEKAFPKPKAAEPFTLNPGDVRFDGDNKQVATVPKPEPVESPVNLQRETVMVGGRPTIVNFNPRTGQYTNLQGQALSSIAPVPPAPRDERLVQVMDDSGRPIWVRESEAVGKPATQAARAVTGQERKVLGFFQRMLDAERNARAVEEKVGGADFAAEYMPGEWLENLATSAEGQQYRQAQRTFTEGRLRKESGAAIPQGEYDTDRSTNFKRPNDTPENVKQKREARLRLLKGAANEAGKALEEFYGPGTTIDSLLSEFGDQGPLKNGTTVTIGGPALNAPKKNPFRK